MCIVIIIDEIIMSGAGTISCNVNPKVCCKLEISEVVRVIIEETPIVSNS